MAAFNFNLGNLNALVDKYYQENPEAAASSGYVPPSRPIVAPALVAPQPTPVAPQPVVKPAPVAPALRCPERYVRCPLVAFSDLA